MASSTTYGDWMRPIAGGIRNIGKPLTFAGLGVLVVTLMLSMVNVVAAIATAVIGIGTIAVLAVRDREHRNVLDRTVERRSWLSESRKGRALYRSGMLAPVESGECRLPGILSRVSLVEANDGFGDRLTLVRHGHTGEYSLLFACQPQGAALADDDVEDAYVASWAGLLEALGGEAGVTQLAVTVDDGEAGVTEVVRGMDLLSSAPRQMYLQELFGFPHPEYAHVPMLLAPDGRRLSKRDRDLDLGILRQRLSREALLGVLAFAAGLIDQEVSVSLNELTKEFSWKKLSGDHIFLDPTRLGNAK